MKKLILLAVIASALLSSCQKNNTPAPNTKNVSGGIGAKSQATLTTDVYAVGVMYTGQPGSAPVYAAYWKNGVPTQLSNNQPSRALCIAISGSDVYIGGFDSGGLYGNGMPVYWKNGVEHFLPVPNKFAGQVNAIVVRDTNVYAVGDYSTFDGQGYSEPTRAMIWKNGVATMLAFNKDNSTATGVALDGNDIFVSGNAQFNGVNCAVYWKNNIWHPFEGTTNSTISSGIAIDTYHNYYISGAGNGALGYWKDSNVVTVPNNKETPPGIIVDAQNNVYIGGGVSNNSLTFPGYVPAYWKNGHETVLPVTGNISGSVAALAVNGTDVYTVGTLFGSNLIPINLYYKNATLVQQLPNCSYIFGIAVIQH